jgi:hypothetical protein
LRGVMTMEVDLQAKVEKYESRAVRCEEQGRLAPDKAQQGFYEVLAGYYRSLATDFKKIIEKRNAA